jgi:transmembrane sensor
MEENYSDMDLARYFSGECTLEEKLHIEAWKEISPANRDTYNAARFIWEKSLEVGTMQFDTEKALTAIHEKLSEPILIPSKNKVFPLYVRIAAIAAVILLPILYFIFYPSNSILKEAYSTYYSGAEIKTLELKDGSRVWLNKFSTLRVPVNFNGKEFNITLNGEAYFQIAHNPYRTFRINTAHNQIEILGTAFNLKASDTASIAVLSVTEGKVRYMQNALAYAKVIEKGQMAISDASRKIITTEPIPDDNFLSWKTHVIRFRNTPLKLALQTLSDYYNTKFVIADTSLNQYPVTTTIVNLPVDEVVKILNLASDSISISKLNSVYQVHKK